jgi:hypothetical protein
LTELVHNYSTFLDRVYSLCLVIEKVNRKPGSEKNPGRERVFHNNASVGNKHRLLQSEMQVVGVFGPYILGLNKLRNCLVHTGGLVQRQHCTGGDDLVFKWKAFDMLVMDER